MSGVDVSHEDLEPLEEEEDGQVTTGRAASEEVSGHANTLGGAADEKYGDPSLYSVQVFSNFSGKVTSAKLMHI